MIETGSDFIMEVTCRTKLDATVRSCALNLTFISDRMRRSALWSVSVGSGYVIHSKRKM